MAAKLQLSRYGFHKDQDQVSWLMEKSSATNAMGLPLSECPFSINNYQLKMECPHEFARTDFIKPTDRSIQLYEDFYKINPIVRFLDPSITPEPKVLFVETILPSHFFRLKQIMNVMNPSYNCIGQVSQVREPKILKTLNISELSSFFLYGITDDDIQKVYRLVLSISSGRLLLAGNNFALYKGSKLLEVIKYDDYALDSFLLQISEEELRRIGADKIYRRLEEYGSGNITT